jgi:formylglycine-generating enzyme required for sulfatase activity
VRDEAFGGSVKRIAAVALVAARLFLSPVAGQHDAGDAARDVFPQFVEVPGGPFTMGADRGRDPQAFDNERWPGASGTGSVDVPAFSISRHEITVAQFVEFARATKWRGDERALAGPASHPVTFVSWPDAIAYCRWLSARLG